MNLDDATRFQGHEQVISHGAAAGDGRLPLMGFGRCCTNLKSGENFLKDTYEGSDVST